jgi:cyclic pyranopterin phosphate synthase
MRFIEFMPVGWAEADWRRLFVPAEEILDRIRPLLADRAARLAEGPGPARIVRLAGSGTAGIIAGVTHPFCRWCSRLRLGANGGLRTCLADPREHDLAGPLRGGAPDAVLADLIRKAARTKPAGADYAAARDGMAVIGG